MTLPEPAILVHVANVFLLLSYAVRDILWLRVLTIGGTLAWIAHDLAVPSPDLVVVGWYAVFVVLNALHVLWLLIERRPVRLDAETAALHARVFPTLAPRDLLRLMQTATWRDAVPGEPLVREHHHLDQLLVLLRGRAVAGRSSGTSAEMGPGDFIGEMSFLTGAPSSATVMAMEPIRYLVWDTPELTRQLEADPALDAAFRGVLGVDLADKLRSAG